MIYNISQTLAATAIEPVTLADFKSWARLEYADAAEWEVLENDINDNLIVAAREICENHIRQNIVLKDVIAWVELYDFFPVPYGEVQGTIAIEDTDANAVTSFTTLGTGNAQIRTLAGTYKLTYQSGMTTVPEAIKSAIKAQALHMYDNRTTGDVSQKAKEYLKGFINFDHY